MKSWKACAVLTAIVLVLAACAGQAGPAGPQGPAGPTGAQGPAGPAGPGLTDEQATAVAAAGKLAGIQFPAIDEVRRGCPACHVVVDASTGAYTLPFEAHERVAAHADGKTHPDVALDGTSIKATDDVNVTVCLQCHAAGTGDRANRGVIAPFALRDIVHPAHMSSRIFELELGGNCFSCHNIGTDGEWYLLTLKVEVNDKGVPADDENLPIPGANPIAP